MANYEQHKITKSGWTKQPNALLRDPHLTSDAFKVISFLLSISGDYHISIKGISKTVNLSEAKVRRATTLLQRAGYLEIKKIKAGKMFAYKWLISDAPGVYGVSTDGTSIDGMSIGGTSMDEHSIDGTSIDAHIYQYTDRYIPKNEELKNEEPKDEGRRDEEDPTPFFSPNQSGEKIISSGEVNTVQAFNRFCEVYPRLGDREEVRIIFFAIPDINNICWQIANSVEWFEKMKRWDDWQSGQKNKYCPQAAKFLERGDWQEFLKSGAALSEEDRLRAALAKSRSIDT